MTIQRSVASGLRPPIAFPQFLLRRRGNLERVDRALLAIYDYGAPATDQDRWALIGFRDGLTWVLSAAFDE